MRLRLLVILLLAGPAHAQTQTVEQTQDVVRHLLLRQLAHALIEQFDLPVLGEIEAAADQFATFIPHAFGNPDANRINTHAAGYFANEARLYGDRNSLAGPHQPLARRAARIACISHGMSAEEEAGLVAWANIPEWEVAVCKQQAAELNETWTALLAPYFRAADAAPTDILIETTNDRLTRDLADAGVFQEAADLFALFRWPETFIPPWLSLAVETCDYDMAWFSVERRVVICDEHLRRISEMPPPAASLAEAWE